MVSSSARIQKGWLSGCSKLGAVALYDFLRWEPEPDSLGRLMSEADCELRGYTDTPATDRTGAALATVSCNDCWVG